MWGKNIFVLLMVLLAQSVVQGKSKTNRGVANFECPLDDDPNDPTHLSVQGDCTKFLKCSFGKAYTLSCPRGQHFSKDLDRCEAIETANCDPTVTTPKPAIGGGGCEFAYKRHPTDCDKGIQCANGQETILQCMEDMYWNQEAERCDFDDSHCQV